MRTAGGWRTDGQDRGNEAIRRERADLDVPESPSVIEENSKPIAGEVLSAEVVQ
jgi:hypothetical protein